MISTIASKNIFDDFVQDCSIAIANALEILQFCTKPSIWWSMQAAALYQ